MKRRSTLLVVCTLVGLLLAGLLDALEPRALDGLFLARQAIHGFQPVDARIRLIVVDEASFGTVGKPFILWHAELAEVMQALVDAGVSVVGMDFLLNAPRAGLPAGHPLLGTLDEGDKTLAEVMRKVPTILVEQLAVADSRFAITGSDPTVRQSSPTLVAAARAVGDASLTTDPDGVVRRLPLPKSLVATLAELMGQPTLSRPELRINYPGPPGSLPQDDFSDVLKRIRGKNPLFEFKGTVCLLVADGWTFQNLVSTPLGTSSTGEVQGAALNTLLLGTYIQRLPLILWVLPSVLLALVGGTLSIRWALPVLVLYLAAALELFTFTGWWLPLAAPTAGLIACYGIRRLRLERGTGSHRRVALLYSHLGGFALATPTQTMRTLEDYVEDMDGIAARFDGTLTRLAGDELLVVFWSADGALNAAQAMLEHVDGIEGFSRIGIAVHAGDVTTGMVSGRLTVLGEEVTGTLELGRRARQEKRRLLVSASARQQCTLTLAWAAHGADFLVGEAPAAIPEPARAEIPARSSSALPVPEVPNPSTASPLPSPDLVTASPAVPVPAPAAEPEPAIVAPPELLVRTPHPLTPPPASSALTPAGPAPGPAQKYLFSTGMLRLRTAPGVQEASGDWLGRDALRAHLDNEWPAAETPPAALAKAPKKPAPRKRKK